MKYLITQPHLSKRQVMWLDILAKFDFEVIHKPEISNAVADALSKLYMMEWLTISEVQPDSKLLKKLEQAYSQDRHTAYCCRAADSLVGKGLLLFSRFLGD